MQRSGQAREVDARAEVEGFEAGEGAEAFGEASDGGVGDVEGAEGGEARDRGGKVREGTVGGEDEHLKT